MCTVFKIILASAIMPTFAVTAQDKAIDVQRSTITIHVGKAGLLSVAGHDHLVSAPISSGVVGDSDQPHVEFKVDAAKMTVKPESGFDANTQAEIQKNMQEKTLESAQYPEITFRSARVVRQAEGRWKLEGFLTLHGVTKPIVASVRREGEAYAGRAAIKQTDFGIKPVSAGGGTVKVKDELEIEFRILTGG